MCVCLYLAVGIYKTCKRLFCISGIGRFLALVRFFTCRKPGVVVATAVLCGQNNVPLFRIVLCLLNN